MHACKPDQGHPADVSYKLKKAFKRFTAVATFYVDQSGDRTASPIVFHVLGDGKTLWKSTPTRDRKSSFTVDVDVSEVDVLLLQIEMVGSGGEARASAIWLDPLLSP